MTSKAEQIGQAILARLAAQAAANRAAGDRLRAEVRALREQYPDYTATALIPRLTRRRLPSVRRVQEILKALRTDSTIY